MNPNPMIQKRLDEIEEERERMTMPPYHWRNPEPAPDLPDWFWLLAMVLFYGGLLGLGVLIGWGIWG